MRLAVSGWQLAEFKKLNVQSIGELPVAKSQLPAALS